MSTIDIAEIRRLSVDERIQLLEKIWSSIAADTEPLPPTPAQMSEIERRIEAFRRDPSRVIPAEDVFARLERDFG
ncbi:addiction module protein [Longimicrobium sp.]|uniref:addiction module protein n=1 Tax=Longimicrobium sp. TaxID=2029185 RepID=UPI002CE74517|nr:addiction module protein [Longimicrobium sp.]HSU14059.1 addiction module protein [Longimicrobium sp.]